MGSEILKSSYGAAGEDLKFNLPDDAAQGLAQQSTMRQSGGFIDTAAQNVFEQSCGENLKFNPNALGAQGQNLNRSGAQNLAGEGFLKSSRIRTEKLDQNGGEQSCGEILKFHSGGCAPQSSNLTDRKSVV